MTTPNSTPDQVEPVGEKVLFLSDDCVRLLEDEYWAELDTEILMGWKSHEQATAEFMAWRAGYRIIQSVTINGI